MKALPPIIVTGGPRSGTTLTMKLLHFCGMQIGKSAEDSPLLEGAIRDEFYKPLLERGGFDPLAQKKLPPVGWEPDWISPEEARSEIMRLSGVEDFSKPWGFKAVKGLFFWQLLDKAFPGAKWVLVARPREEHIDSLMRTSFMNAYDTREEWGAYLDGLSDRVTKLLTTKDLPESIVFSPAYIRAQLPGYCEYLVKRAGLEWNPKAVQVFDPNLYQKAKA